MCALITRSGARRRCTDISHRCQGTVGTFSWPRTATGCTAPSTARPIRILTARRSTRAGLFRPGQRDGRRARPQLNQQIKKEDRSFCSTLYRDEPWTGGNRLPFFCLVRSNLVLAARFKGVDARTTGERATPFFERLCPVVTTLSMPLEILHGALVLLRRGSAVERAEIAPPAGLRIHFARIKTIFAGRKFSNHGGVSERNDVILFKPQN